MSDFFDEDFTAELKSYYLQSLSTELNKFTDLLDSSTYKRVHAEIYEQCQTWIVDAKSNEFEYFSLWLQSLSEKMTAVTTCEDLIQALNIAKRYVEKLTATKKDSADYITHFALTMESQAESLYLHCKVATQEFVISVKHVVEVVGSLPVYPLPEKHPNLLGVISFRGEAIPVFCLQNYGFQKIQTTDLFYVICDFEGTHFCLQVSETDELISVQSKDLQSIEPSSAIMSVPFVRNFFVRDQRSIMIVDIEKLVAA